MRYRGWKVGERTVRGWFRKVTTAESRPRAWAWAMVVLEEGLVSKVHTVEHPDGDGGVSVRWGGG